MGFGFVWRDLSDTLSRISLVGWNPLLGIAHEILVRVVN